MSVNTYFFRHLTDYLLRVPAIKLLIDEWVPACKLLISEWSSELLIAGRILDYNMFLSEGFQTARCLFSGFSKKI